MNHTHYALNTRLHRVSLLPKLTEADLDRHERERIPVPLNVPHEHPPTPMKRSERIGHRVVAVTLGVSLFAFSVMAFAGWLPGGGA